MGGGDIFWLGDKIAENGGYRTKKKCATLHGRRMDLNQATGMTSDTMSIWLWNISKKIEREAAASCQT